MLMAMIENIYETMNLRITETAFELHLRKIYPTRNIVSMRETDTIAGQECLDVQKKTDGSVNIIGEVATDPVASWMIQSAQVASKFTLFTHHAKTFPDLVTALRNSMLRAGVFKNEKTLEGKFDKFFDNATHFFMKTTDKQLYIYRNILEYIDGEYIITNKISDKNIKEMRLNMTDGDAKEFDEFVARNWGEESVYKMEEERKEKSKLATARARRGRKSKETE